MSAAGRTLHGMLQEALGEHRDYGYKEVVWRTCRCGWAVEWAGLAARARDLYDAHLADVAAAVVKAWLAGERETVAEEVEHAHWCESNYTRGCNCIEWRTSQADAALASLVARIDGSAE